MSSLFTVNTYCLIDKNDSCVISLYSEYLLSDKNDSYVLSLYSEHLLSDW
jgi:hypothetical protein